MHNQIFLLFYIVLQYKKKIQWVLTIGFNLLLIMIHIWIFFFILIEWLVKQSTCWSSSSIGLWSSTNDKVCILVDDLVNTTEKSKMQEKEQKRKEKSWWLFPLGPPFYRPYSLSLYYCTHAHKRIMFVCSLILWLYHMVVLYA